MVEGFDAQDLVGKTNWWFQQPAKDSSYGRWSYDTSTPFGTGRTLKYTPNAGGTPNYGPAVAEYSGALTNSSNKLTIGFWFRRGVAQTPYYPPQATYDLPFGGFYDGGTNFGTRLYQFSQGLTVNTVTGVVRAFRSGTNGSSTQTQLGVSAVPIDQNKWTFLEITVSLNASTGVFQLRQDGVKTIDFTGNTVATYTTFQTAGVAVGIASAPYDVRAPFWFDDLYVLNDQGSVNNSPLGPVRVQTLLPSGAGTDTQLTPAGGTTNWSNAADVPSDPTRYNYGTVVGNRDTYALADLAAATTTVYGVQTTLYAAAGGPQVATLAATDSITNAPDLSNNGAIISGAATWDNTAATSGEVSEPGGQAGYTNFVWHKLYVTTAGTLTVLHSRLDPGDSYVAVYTGPANANYSQIGLVASNDDYAYYSPFGNNVSDNSGRAGLAVAIAAGTWVYIASTGSSSQRLSGQHLYWSVGAIANAGMRPALRSGGNLYYDPSGAFGAVPSSVAALRETNPATSAAWTPAAVNALEVGAEVA